MRILLHGLKPFEDSFYDGVEGCGFDFGGADASKAIYRAEPGWNAATGYARIFL